MQRVIETGRVPVKLWTDEVEPGAMEQIMNLGVILLPFIISPSCPTVTKAAAERPRRSPLGLQGYTPRDRPAERPRGGAGGTAAPGRGERIKVQ